MSATTARQQRPEKPLRPLPRVRKEYPTVEEAIMAAEGLSENLDEQAEIAAGLMGISQDEVRPLLNRPKPRATSIVAGRRTIVVERRGFRVGRSG